MPPRERAITLANSAAVEDTADWQCGKELPNGGWSKSWRKNGWRHYESKTVHFEQAPGGQRRTVTHTVIDEPASVAYVDILEACFVVPDENIFMDPWEGCDFYAHSALPLSLFLEHHPQAEFNKMRNFARYQRVLIVDACNDSPTWEYFHYRGASKQVARQLEAKALRECVDQIVEWRNNGCEYWGVECDFEDYEASLWGIDGEDYAEQHRVEVANEVVAAMEKDGWVVTGKPAPPPSRKDDLRRTFKHNLHLFDMSAR